MIVARSFPGPAANPAPLDRDTSFHGTFVSGVVAGDAGTDVTGGGSRAVRARQRAGATRR